MPSIDLLVQADGFYRGWSSLSAGTDGYKMVNDSASTSHDSDSTYLILPRLTDPGGIISFPCFRMAEGLIPTSIMVTVVAKIETGSPLLKLGWSTPTGTKVITLGSLTPLAGYSALQTTFNTDPFSGGGWTAEGLVGLEALVQMKAATVATARITLVSVQLTYTTRVSVGVTHEPIVSQTS